MLKMRMINSNKLGKMINMRQGGGGRIIEI